MSADKGWGVPDGLFERVKLGANLGAQIGPADPPSVCAGNELPSE